MHRYFKRYFTERTALDENAILNDLEPALRQEVGTFLIHGAVRKNYLFSELDAPMLSKLFAVFKPTPADIGMELVTRNQPGQTMFVIQNGVCQRKMGASGLDSAGGAGSSSTRAARSASSSRSASRSGTRTASSRPSDATCTSSRATTCARRSAAMRT